MMGENQGANTESMALLEAWIKSTTQFWTSMQNMWSPSAAPATAQESEPQKSRAQETLESALKILDSLSAAAQEPETASSVFKGMNIFPQIINRMARTAWETYSHFQQQWMVTAERLSRRTEAYKFDDLDKDVFRAWTELYENEFRKFLNIPPLGLTRFYQERMSMVTDRYTLFQGTVTEFFHMLYLPMEKSFKAMEEKVASMAEEGTVPQDPNEFYKMWIKILEGHYMVLFKSSDYTKILGEALSAMEDFLMARHEMLQDLMQSLPVPTNKDMDDVYKELYELKKRIKKLENKDLED
jgi:hypothetical protein